tara:strand:- start:14183 stop:14692 length:510 start_codon:yes stop_codon:yes gene_type:complete
VSKFTDKALHSQAVAAAKRKFKVWPSAYASGFVVQHYKRLYKRKHGSTSGAFRGDNLGKWFGEKWVRIGSSGKIAGPCGGRSEKEGKPKCLPRAKAQAMSVEERKRLVARKRKKDPNPDRRGKAIMSSSKTAKDAETLGSMSKESNSKRNNVRERLAKLMDAYKNSNRY